jgi:hypothetical protein
MSNRYWRVKVKGDATADEIHRSVGSAGGQVLRVHREKGETHVFFASANDKEAHGVAADGQATEVKLDDVTKI